MIEQKNFKEWLKTNTSYTDAVVSDLASRIKRADYILEWNGDETYLFYLEKEPEFQKLSVSVKSQLRRSVKLYSEYYKRLQKQM